LLHSTIEYFTLNVEQTRAFVLVAKHLHHHDPDPLHMYLGGMGGTGKTRVIQSVMEFLIAREEGYRFLVLGPTGTSASQLGGSTYHSVLGFGFESDGSFSQSTLEAIRGRLKGVDLIFIDEVSMISCEELLRI
ncbi:P-loop containing nucleoside triphosphate hydrolase protein, partial [Cubamyces lactineus]